MTKEKIQAAEKEIFEKKMALAKMRKELPKEEVKDYNFQGIDGQSIKLSELFGDKKDLIIVHNMGKQCPYCTLWADGYNGVLNHLENRTGFVVVSPDDPATQKEFAQGRNWNFKMYSGQGDTFIKDMGYEMDDGKYHPGVSSFQMGEESKIYRIATTHFGPGDDFCSVWPFLDLLAEGANGWTAKFSY